MPGGPRGTTWAMVHIVPLVVADLFEDDELDFVKVERDATAGLTLQLSARGETAAFYIWSPGWAHESDGEVRRRVAAEVEDFIAESRFAWGQRRSYTSG